MSIIDEIREKLFSDTEVDEKIEEAAGLNVGKEQVEEIKRLAEEKTGGIDLKAVAEKTGISEETVDKILSSLGLNK